MSEGPISARQFFDDLKVGIEASFEDRKADKADLDDLYYGVSMIYDGQYIAAPRAIDLKGFQRDLYYVQKFGRPEGYERPDPFTEFKKAAEELAPGIIATYQNRMQNVVDNLEEGYEAYADAALDHEEDQYRKEAQDNFNRDTPLSIHSMAEFLLRNIVNSQQANLRAAGRLDGPLEIDAEIEKKIAATFATATRDPVNTLYAIEGRGDEVRPMGVRNFLRALDPKFFELITKRNSPQLANSSAVPESSMPSTELTKYVLKAQSEARMMGDANIEPRHLFLAMIQDESVQAELNALNKSALKINTAEIREEFYTDEPASNVESPEPSTEFTMLLTEIGPGFTGKHAASIAVQDMIESYPEISDALKRAGFTDRRLERWADLSGTDIKPVNHKPFKIDDHTYQQYLKAFTRDITEMAAEGKLDPIIGREEELEQMKTIMTHRKKKNPMVIGEPGVGKTALLHGYAQDVVEGNVPDAQKGAKILELDLKAMIAGTRYRGEFEERMQIIIEGTAERNERGDRPPIILGIDEAHNLIGLGTNKGEAGGADQLIKPALQEGNLWTIMFTTEDEFSKNIEGDGALERRTQTLKVEEPSPEDTLAILHGLKGKYEEHYDLTYTDDAIETMVALGGKYIHNRNFPDKGIDLLDGAGAVAFKKREEQIKRGETDLVEEITRDDIIEVVSRMAKLPKSYLSQDGNDRYINLADNLKGDVFGQDHAVEELADAVQYAKAGLREPNKPVGSYLFVGPTGVGKTELAKSLAKHTTGDEENIIRIDMSEYMEKHTVGKLIGAPAGYVGYGEEGVLTGAVRKNPNAVIVLDEIEKAHPDIQKLLLGVMDDGKMKDGRGREINFQNNTLVMTSNLGAAKANAEADKEPMGFNRSKEEVDRGKIMQTEVESFFAPEFLGRLDGVIKFNELNKDVAGLILNSQIKKLGERVKQSYGVTLELADKVRDTLMEQGFNPRLGARPLKQAIDRLVGKPLAKWLMTEGKDVRKGQTLHVEDTGADFSVSKDGGDDLLINPKRVVGPQSDLPGDALARLRDRRNRRPANDAPKIVPPTPGQVRRFGGP